MYIVQRAWLKPANQTYRWCYLAEKQREEQRQRKLFEKRGRLEETPERYYWADSSGATNRPNEGRGHPPQPPAHEPNGAMRWVDPSTQGSLMDPGLSELNRHSAPPLKVQGPTGAPTQNPNNGEGNRFAVRLISVDFLGFIFIHSAISIAPLQVLYYSEALPTTARILYRSFTPKRTGNCR